MDIDSDFPEQREARDAEPAGVPPADAAIPNDSNADFADEGTPTPATPEPAPAAAPSYRFGDQEFTSIEDANAAWSKLQKQLRDKDSYIGKLKSQPSTPAADPSELIEKTVSRLLERANEQAEAEKRRSTMSDDERYSADIDARFKLYDDRLGEVSRESQQKILETKAFFERRNMASEAIELKREFPELTDEHIEELRRRSASTWDPNVLDSRKSLRAELEYAMSFEPLIVSKLKKTAEGARKNAAGAVPGASSTSGPIPGAADYDITDPKARKAHMAKLMAGGG